LKKILILILISLSIVGKSQKFGDSIVFTTYSGKHYNGTIEEVDQDGYFFKTQHSRSIYLSKGEIKEYQTINNNRNEPVQQKIKEFQDLNNKKEIPKEIIENPTTETRVIAYSKSQLSLLTGIDNLNIILHDGRRIVGTIEKIKYKGIEGLGDAMISISGENQNYNIKKTEIVSLYKNVAVIIPKKKNLNENSTYFNENYSESNENTEKSVSLIIHGWSGIGRTGGGNNLILGSLAEIKINGESLSVGLGIDYSYIESASSRDWNEGIYEWQRIHFRTNFYIFSDNAINIYLGIGVGKGKGIGRYSLWNGGAGVTTYNNLWTNFSFRSCLGGKYHISDNFGLMGEIGVGAGYLRAGLFIKI
jgi:hypothetical protein